jgi:hypothetical protein
MRLNPSQKFWPWLREDDSEAAGTRTHDLVDQASAEVPRTGTEILLQLKAFQSRYVGKDEQVNFGSITKQSTYVHR